jgi:hypothetical protein
MAKPELNKTYASTGLDQKVNRGNQLRRDNDTIKIPKCSIYDVDYAILSYIRDVIKPQIIEDQLPIAVPAMFANSEKWSMVQKHGYLRDAKGKLMSPLISLKRNSIVERDNMKKLDVNINPNGNSLLFKSKYTKNNQYDRFNILQGEKPVEEYYVSSVPEYVDVSYDMLLWTEYTDQMNSLIEQIMPTGGFAWGTTWKFATYLDDYSFETMNMPGEDRLVRATIPLRCKATLLGEQELHKTTMQKQLSVKKVSFATPVTKFNVNVIDPPPDGWDGDDKGKKQIHRKDFEHAAKNRKFKYKGTEIKTPDHFPDQSANSEEYWKNH